MSLVLVAAIVFVALGLATVRVLRGPTDTDRVVALDLFFVAAVVLAIVASLAVERTVFLDAAIGLALVGFVASSSWARMIERSNAQTSHRDEPIEDER